MSTFIPFTSPLRPVEVARAIADALAESYFRDFYRRRGSQLAARGSLAAAIAPPTFDLEEHRWEVSPDPDPVYQSSMWRLGSTNNHHLDVLGEGRYRYRDRYGAQVHVEAVRALLMARGWPILSESALEEP